MFIDTAKISVKAGDGGDGVNSFYRDRLTRKGHPDGGDGGCGGNIILRVSKDAYTFLDFQYRRHFRSGDGKNGSGKKKKGADGKDCIINLPAGTLVFDEAGELLADLTETNEELIIAKGGEAGKGNRSHKDATEGKPGEEKTLILELKLIADVGIIGFPNSGKSTLLARISNAHPKIAPYPFTSKAPVLGVVRGDNFEFKAAEVPGLIKGAYRGKGLGDLFLRHIERTRLLVHLIDAAETTRDPFCDYQDINEELRLYGKGVEKKPKILAANKIDSPAAGENVKMLQKKIKQKLLLISAKTGQGIDGLICEVRRKLHLRGVCG